MHIQKYSGFAIRLGFRIETANRSPDEFIHKHGVPYCGMNDLLNQGGA
jgi:hypothetical protein